MGARHYEIVIDVPTARVWDAIADFGGIWRMNASVTNSYLTGDRPTGIGATRHCDLTIAGASIEERVVDWHDGRSYTIEIYDGEKSPPFKHNRASLAVAPTDDGRTVLSFDFTYELKYGAAGALMDRVMVEPRFGPAIKRLPASIARHVETGEQVDDDTDLTTELARISETLPVVPA